MADNMQENYLLNFTDKRLLLERWAKTSFSYSYFVLIFVYQEKRVEKKIDDPFSSIPATLESLVNGDAEFVYSVVNGVG